ncbi:hypothetical protein LTR83_003977 [Exophiala xenobiotica]|nr:hypothetical protein LTR83_003977 [Exophiala xenobiotica]
MALSTSSSDFSNTTTSSHPPKRMRLGTKSCTECRRRRVRCAFPLNSRTCEACELHEIDCVPQRPRPRPSGQGKSHHDNDSEEKSELQHRLGNLEAMVRQIASAINLDPETATWAQLQAESLRRLRSPSTVATAAAAAAEPSAFQTFKKGSIASSAEFLDDNSPDDLDQDQDQDQDQFEDAPLVSLFKDALHIERPRPDLQEPRGLCTDERIKACLESLGPFLPSADDLRLILEESQMFWCLWPMPPPGQNTTDPSPSSRILAARDFIVDSLNSGRPAIMAKALIWLTLCIHQLPRDFACIRGEHLQNSPRAIWKHYLNTAETLLSFDDAAGASQGKNMLECLLLQMKIYIDVGKPRKAWLAIRRALDTGLLLGLQRQGRYTTNEQKSLWAHIWQIDRFLSLILGMPSGISNAHPSLAKECAGPTIEAQLMHDLAIIAGRIIERNQDANPLNDNNYSVTMDIDQDLERCKARIPVEWWDSAFTAGLPLAAAHAQQTIKLFYATMRKNLHLPYLLRAWSRSPEGDMRYEYEYESSRISTLEACRDAIRSYRAFRNTSGGGGKVPIICDLMDFQAFSATVTLVVDLLLSSSSSSSSSSASLDSSTTTTSKIKRDAFEEAQDWDLVHSVSGTLQEVSKRLNCNVAGQGTDVLERLSMARYGKYPPGGTGSDSETFEVVIPYFGKVRIGRVVKKPAPPPALALLSQTPPSQQQQQQQQQPASASWSESPKPLSFSFSSGNRESQQQQQQQAFSSDTTVVEFSLCDHPTTSFAPSSYGLTGQSSSMSMSMEDSSWLSDDAELGMDWESFVHVNTNYDWSQFFESAMPDTLSP